MSRNVWLHSGQPVLIFGAGAFACSLAAALRQEGVEVAAFVVESPSTAMLCDCPVYSWSHLQAAADLQGLPLLCGIFNRDHPYQQLAAIASAHGFADMLMPWEYYPALASALGWRYWLSTQPQQLAQPAVWPEALQQVHDLLYDDESRHLLRRTVAFRAGADLAFSAVRSPEEQYFNALTLAAGEGRDGLVLLDVGAYDGDTLSAAAAKTTLSRALLFEPCQANLQRLNAHVATFLADHPTVEVEVMPLALANGSGYVRLGGEGEAATLLSADPALPAAVDSLVHAVRADDLYPSLRVDFIKIDAEGTDLACIEGMAGIITRSRPIVAVAVYHRDRDLIEIPLALAQLLGREGYRYHLRQHQFNSFDGVFYAVPDR